jgi:hypothetical protein
MLVRHQQCSKGKPTLPISAVSFQEASLSGGPLLARVSIRHTTTHITLQQIQKGAWLLAAVATQTLSPALDVEGYLVLRLPHCMLSVKTASCFSTEPEHTDNISDTLPFLVRMH